MTLGQVYDTPLGHGQQLCEILSKSKLAMRNYGPDTDFWYEFTVTLTSEIWPWFKVMTHLSVKNNKSVKYYLDPTWQFGIEELWPGHGFWYMCSVTLTLEIWSWVKVMTHPWAMNNNCVKYYLDPIWQRGVMARTQIFGICTLWPWPWIYDLGLRSRHTLGSWTTIVWNIK